MGVRFLRIWRPPRMGSPLSSESQNPVPVSRDRLVWPCWGATSTGSNSLARYLTALSILVRLFAANGGLRLVSRVSGPDFVGTKDTRCRFAGSNWPKVSVAAAKAPRCLTGPIANHDGRFGTPLPPFCQRRCKNPHIAVLKFPTLGRGV